jgi:hypothetical protein
LYFINPSFAREFFLQEGVDRRLMLPCMRFKYLYIQSANLIIVYGALCIYKYTIALVYLTFITRAFRAQKTYRKTQTNSRNTRKQIIVFDLKRWRWVYFFYIKQIDLSAFSLNSFLYIWECGSNCMFKSIMVSTRNR